MQLNIHPSYHLFLNIILRLNLLYLLLGYDDCRGTLEGWSLIKLFRKTDSESHFVTLRTDLHLPLIPYFMLSILFFINFIFYLLPFISILILKTTTYAP